MPALPELALDRPTSPHQVNAEDLFKTLMTEHLGYPAYLVSGTDIGAGVATRLAVKYPDAVEGIHIASVVDPALAYVPALHRSREGLQIRLRTVGGRGRRL